MNNGAIFAAMISDASAGVINNCSTVPYSFSVTRDAAATTDPFNTSNVPNVPVRINQEFSSPGLYSNDILAIRFAFLIGGPFTLRTTCGRVIAPGGCAAAVPSAFEAD